MIYKIVLTILVYLCYIIANIYWHKKIIESKWLYTIYTTIIIIIWTLFVK